MSAPSARVTRGSTATPLEISARSATLRKTDSPSFAARLAATFAALGRTSLTRISTIRASHSATANSSTKARAKEGSRFPTLREVARTAPYMHDGSLATLEDVVNYYD